MTLLPTKKQWKSWSLPSKLTAIGTLIAIISFLFFFGEKIYIIVVGPSTSLDGLYKRAISYKESGQEEKAFELFYQLYSKRPDYPNVAYFIGSYFKNKGERREALAALKSVPANEKHADLEYKKAFLYYELGNYQKSASCIVQALLDLTINDNRYYIAKSLQVYLINYNKGVERLSEAANKFCDDIDYLLVREGDKSNEVVTHKHLTVPTTGLFRRLDYTIALKDSAFFAMSKLMNLQFQLEHYSACLESFNRCVKYVQGPQSFYINVDEKGFISLLEMAARSLNSINTDDYAKYKEVEKTLDSVEKRNQIKYECISEMSHLIRIIYFDKTTNFALKNLKFSLLYGKGLKWDKAIQLIKLKSSQYLFGNKTFKVNGIRQYIYQDEIAEPGTSKINDFGVYISGCDHAGRCSKTVQILPYVKVEGCKE